MPRRSSAATAARKEEQLNLQCDAPPIEPRTRTATVVEGDCPHHRQRSPGDRARRNAARARCSAGGAAGLRQAHQNSRIDRNTKVMGRVAALWSTSPAQGGDPGWQRCANGGRGLLAKRSAKPIMRSDANEAPDARQEIIDVYMAWRHGKMATAGGSIDPVALGTAVATAVVAALEPW